MKFSKKFITGCAVALMLAATSITAFAAATYNTPAEAAAGVCGKTVEEVTLERQNGTTYGKIAAEAGKLEEFEQAMQDIYKDALDARVAGGTLTQAQADELLAARAERQANCDGSKNGAGNCGLCPIGGRGEGRAMRAGRSMGGGRGMQNGSCIYRQ